MLHLNLSEVFALNWVLNKCWQYLWSSRFTTITDCYGLLFILSYDVKNPVIFQMQMRFMLWEMDLEHCVNSFLVGPDYLSRCKEDLCYNLLVAKFLNFYELLVKMLPA